jgi:glycosyltransferase involved in cell wall biosynthesis
MSVLNDPRTPDVPTGDLGAVCYYTPSVEPSGMGAHMLELIAGVLADGEAKVVLLCRPTEGGRRLLDEAHDLGAVAEPLPGPRDDTFADVVLDALGQWQPEVFHSHVGIGWESYGAPDLARKAGVPLILQTQHLPCLLSHPGKRRRLVEVLAGFDRVLAVSQGVADTYRALGVPVENIVTVENGIAPSRRALDRRAARAALGLTPQQPVILTVGRLTHMKAQHLLIEATRDVVARFADAAVVLIGEGPLRAALAAQAAATRVAGSVRLVGHRTDARALLAAADVFVLCSRYEGMPLAVLEAMEAGLPVVATRAIGNDEVVEHGVTGTLVPAGDASELGAAITALLADPRRRASYGKAGRQRYLQHFTADRMVARTRAQYQELLRRPGCGGVR